jgi:hypothetical protein
VLELNAGVGAGVGARPDAGVGAGADAGVDTGVDVHSDMSRSENLDIRRHTWRLGCMGISLMRSSELAL